MVFEIKLQEFTGPLPKLLELIEAQKLEITRVSLSLVTADFIDYITRLAEEHPPTPETNRDTWLSQVLSEFLVVAGKLLLLKSKVLLPTLELTEEEEHEIQDLESRLSLYREFKKGSVNLKQLWHEYPQTRSRPLFFAQGEAGLFYPPPRLAPEDLERVFRGMLQELRVFLKTPETIKTAMVSLEEKIKELLARLEGAAGTSFNSILKNQPRIEIISLFLALLHILKGRSVRVTQSQQFGDIMVESQKE